MQKTALMTVMFHIYCHYFVRSGGGEEGVGTELPMSQHIENQQESVWQRELLLMFKMTKQVHLKLSEKNNMRVIRRNLRQ